MKSATNVQHLGTNYTIDGLLGKKYDATPVVPGLDEIMKQAIKTGASADSALGDT